MIMANKKQWIEVADAEAFPEDLGVAVKTPIGQIAVFHFASRNEWYATDNLCPHKKQMVLARGLLGEAGEEPKVICPLHKRCFNLKNGKQIGGDEYCVNTYPVKVEEGKVYLELGS